MEAILTILLGSVSFLVGVFLMGLWIRARENRKLIKRLQRIPTTVYVVIPLGVALNSMREENHERSSE